VPGARLVLLVGLRSATAREHNGRLATLEAWLPEPRGRYTVRLVQQPQLLMHVKPHNLRPLGQPAAAAAAAATAAQQQQEQGEEGEEGEQWGLFSSSDEEQQEEEAMPQAAAAAAAAVAARPEGWDVFGSSSSSSDDEQEDPEDGGGGAGQPGDGSARPQAQAGEGEGAAAAALRMVVHTADAARWARRRVQAGGAGRYDAILLDVYTQERFPSALLTRAFFQDLVRPRCAPLPREEPRWQACTC
jgi:hypothetical protein